MPDTPRVTGAGSLRNGSLCLLPPQLPPMDTHHGGDLLAEATLRVAMPLIAGLPEPLRSTMGIVIGTQWGCLEIDQQFERSRQEAGGRYASPAAFARTLPSTVMAEIALKGGIRGPALVVSRGATSAGLAIQCAVRWMDHFSLTYRLAGGIEWHKEEVTVGLVLLAPQRSGWPMPHAESLPALIDWITAQ